MGLHLRDLGIFRAMKMRENIVLAMRVLSVDRRSLCWRGFWLV